MPLWKKFVPADTPAHAPIYSLHYTQLIDVVKVGEVLQFNSVDYTLVKEVERHYVGSPAYMAPGMESGEYDRILKPGSLFC